MGVLQWCKAQNLGLSLQTRTAQVVVVKGAQRLPHPV
jgi:hypothetical protein